MTSLFRAGSAESIALLEVQTRRHFLSASALGLGGMFLASLHAGNRASASSAEANHDLSRFDISHDAANPLSALPPQFEPKTRRIIYLHMGGGPSQLEFFDYKPELAKADGKTCPESFMKGKRFAFISGLPKLKGPMFPFHRAGQSGAWISNLQPFLEKHVDDICFVKSMRTDQFNHVPATLAIQTGDARLGKASLGAWVTYGLGTENQNLPGFIVLHSAGGAGGMGKQFWGSGYLPSAYQGIECRTQGDPILYLKNPEGVDRPLRRHVIDAIDEINRANYDSFGNPETITRIAQYEMAFRMQLEASDVMDIKKEPEAILQKYGAKPGQASFANNCLIARRLVERGVRFIQLYDGGWDHHSDLKDGLIKKCRETDQPIVALLSDLKSRGLLEDTLVVWGGEFGRTPMMQGSLDGPVSLIGRDHHPGAFTMWMAGGGVKPGISYGETDEMGYEIVKDPVEVRDLHATILYLLGFDHHKLSYPYQGLDQKLTGVKPARVVREILA